VKAVRAEAKIVFETARNTIITRCVGVPVTWLHLHECFDVLAFKKLTATSEFVCFSFVVILI